MAKIKSIGRRYIASPNGVVHKKDAQKVGEALEEAKRKAGKLTSEAVVEYARPASSPLHKYFEWSDKKAADSYRRLYQAPHLVRSVRVEVVVEGKKEEVAAFMNITHTGSSSRDGYESMNEVSLGSEATIQRAVEELRDWRLRWRGVAKLKAIFKVVDSLTTKVLNGRNVRKKRIAA